jgi:hypothetical protein
MSSTLQRLNRRTSASVMVGDGLKRGRVSGRTERRRAERKMKEWEE